MRKMSFIIIMFIGLTACTDGSNQGGVVDDGFDAPTDPNGALIDSTPNQPWDPSIDTLKGEHRVDLQRRDSSVLRLDSAYNNN